MLRALYRTYRGGAYGEGVVWEIIPVMPRSVGSISFTGVKALSDNADILGEGIFTTIVPCWLVPIGQSSRRFRQRQSCIALKTFSEGLGSIR
jgi:hypothetical protein